jgi:hypothetical protein
MLNLPQNRDHLQLMRLERDGVVYRNGIDIKDREQITDLRVIVNQANGTIRGVLQLPEGLQLTATTRLLVWVRRIEDPTVNFPPVQADGRGQFLVQNLVAGTYEFNVRAVGAPGEQPPGIRRPTQTVVVANGAIADITIALQMSAGPSGP